MHTEPGQRAPANDNRFRVITDTIRADEAAGRLDEVLQDLSKAGAVDAVLIEALFSSMLSHASRASLERPDDPERLQMFERYNQLSRLSGVLELFKAELMRDYVDGLVKG